MTEVTAHHGLFKDTNLHVDDAGGAGRPVVLIHGWPLSGKSFEEQIPALQEAGYRPITYDRRGFGLSSKPQAGYNYDVLAEDLQKVLVELDLSDVTLVGFSMGGGEVARYLGLYGPARIRSVVFASAVTPYLMRTDGNPDGPLTPEQADGMAEDLVTDEAAFYDSFTRDFFSVDGVLKVSEVQRKEAGAMCGQANKNAALACMAAFGGTDFRGDLADVTVPALVIHGDGDATVPFEGSGRRTHAALADSEVHVIKDAPHGCNVSHAEEWNSVVVEFLAK